MRYTLKLAVCLKVGPFEQMRHKNGDFASRKVHREDLRYR